MAEDVSALKVSLGLDSADFSKSITDINRKLKVVDSEFKAASTSADKFGNASEQLKLKQTQLSQKFDLQKDKVEQLRKQYERSVETKGKDAKETDLLRIKLNQATGQMNKTEGQLKSVNERLTTQTSKWDQLKNKMENVSTGFKNAGEKISGLGKNLSIGLTAPIMAGATALGALVKKTADAADAAAKNARKVGVSTEAYQEYTYALGQTGLSAGDTDKALGRLNQRIGMARDGSEKYSEALQKAGVDMQALANGSLTTDEAMMQSIEGLSKITNEQDRAAAATELFGVKLARELMPALEGGAEGLEATRQKARDLGIIMSDEAAVKAEEFNDKMQDLTSAFKGAFQQLGTKLIPILTDQLIPVVQDKVIPAILQFSEKLASLSEWFFNLSPKMQKTIGIIVGVTAAIGPLLIVAGSLATGIGALIPIFSAVGIGIGAISAPVAIAVGAFAGLVAGGVALYKNWDTVKEKAGKLKNYLGDVVRDIKGYFSNLGDKLKFNIPKPKIPKFSISGKFDLIPPDISIPKIGVTWHKTGGVFTKPVTMGNAGFGDVEEAIVPFSGDHANKIAGLIGKAMNKYSPNNTQNQQNNNNGNQKVTYELVLNVDGYETARAIVDHLDLIEGGRMNINDRMGGVK